MTGRDHRYQRNGSNARCMAPIHTVTWRDDALQQTKIQVLDSFVQRREIALTTPWRCYPDRVALLSDRRGTASWPQRIYRKLTHR